MQIYEHLWYVICTEDTVPEYNNLDVKRTEQQHSASHLLSGVR